MQCPRCQHEHGPTAKFCEECAYPVAAAAGGRPDSRFASPDSYTPRHLAERILTSRSALEGERKQVTVLFADLNRSLELLADRDPEEARQILDPVLERMMEAVHRYEGTVNQVMGDGIMALFGAPLAQEDHAVRACYAALSMQESVGRYAEAVRRRHGVDVQVRIGVSSGEVVVRSIASDLRMDYTAVGSTTHTAARMEQLARPGTTLLTTDTFKLAEGYVTVRSLGPTPIKGLAAPVEVYELVAAGPARTRLQAAHGRGLTPFVDREVELDRVWHALARGETGHGQVVAVVGEPGAGKSRLLMEVTAAERARPWLTLEGTALGYGQATPYLPLIEALRGYFQIRDADDHERVRDQIAARLVRLDHSLPFAPFLALFDVPAEDPSWRGLTRLERRGRTLDAISGLLLAVARVQPLLVVIENLHWADSETLAVLDRLVDDVAAARAVLLLSYRPEYGARWIDRAHYTEIRTDPLPAERVEELFRAVAGPDPSLEALAPLVIERTQGNPFFLEETVRSLVDSQVLVGERRAYRLVAPVHAVRVPSTLQALLATRIDRLSPDDKRLLQTASVIGRRVPLPLLEAVVDLPDDALRAALARLRAAQFLDETSIFPELEYTFRHAVTHEVTYGSVVGERRRALHARIVTALEAKARNERVDLLAHHALRGDVWDKAVTYCREAGARAMAQGANRQAVAWFEHALAANERLPQTRESTETAIELRLELRPALLQLGRLAEVLTRSQEAEGLAQWLGDTRRLGRVYAYLINYNYLKGEQKLALEYGQRCLEIGDRAGDLSLEGLARRYMGHSYHAQGLYQQARLVLGRNVSLLEAARRRPGDVEAALSYVASAGWLALTLAELGDFDAAQAYCGKAQRAAEGSRHPYSEAIAWTLTGLVAARRGQLDPAVVPLEQSLRACRDKHLVLWRPIPTSVLGLVRVLAGRVDDGVRLLEEAVALTEALGVKAYLALWLAQLAEGYLAAGDTERAAIVAHAALDGALRHDERGHHAYVLRLLGAIAACQDPPDLPASEGHYREAVRLAGELGMRPLVAHGHLGLGLLHRRAGNREQARAHLTTATTLFGEMAMRYWGEQAEAALGGLA